MKNLITIKVEEALRNKCNTLASAIYFDKENVLVILSSDIRNRNNDKFNYFMHCLKEYKTDKLTQYLSYSFNIDLDKISLEEIHNFIKIL